MIIAALAALALMAEASATPLPILKGSDLAVRPSGEDFARFFPRKAQMGNVEGEVDLQCRVTRAGTLAECQVTAEDPPGFEFAAAALRLSPFFKLTAEAATRQAGAMVRISIRFMLPRDPGSARLKAVSLKARAGGPGRAEVSCQVFTGRLSHCFVVSATPASVASDALAAATDFSPGDLPLGLRFIVPIDFVAAPLPPP